MKRNKAFTLIELVSVLVILAILVLIVTPLVLNIIRKARISADKRSIDAYGRSVELAIADYLLDTGNFPTSIEQLTIEYSGDTVSCTTTQLNSDTSVYLANCTVNGRVVTGYTYGKVVSQQETYRAYNVGQLIEYKGISFYVIKDSDATESSVTLLKAEPLTYEELLTYSTEIEVSKSNQNNYGGISYGNTNDYNNSYVKIIVDNWAKENFESNSYAEVRLITIEELIEDLKFEWGNINATTRALLKTSSTPNLSCNTNYWYWAMSPADDSSFDVLGVGESGSYYFSSSFYYSGSLIRPVLVLYKDSL